MFRHNLQTIICLEKLTLRLQFNERNRYKMIYIQTVMALSKYKSHKSEIV